MEVTVNNLLTENLGTIRLNTAVGPFFMNLGPLSTGSLPVPSPVISVDIMGQTVPNPQPGPVVLPDGVDARLVWTNEPMVETLDITGWQKEPTMGKW